jgi:pimeloyl-ACP methyl ester carboxylesterase
MIPGLGDGLTTVKGMAIPFSIMYRKFAKDYKVYVFSRKNKLEEGYSTRDMARDVMKAMRKLRIKKAHIMGVSQGGMISQHLAIHYPEFVDKLILCVTIGKQNPTIQRVVSYWYRLAKKGNYVAGLVGYYYGVGSMKNITATKMEINGVNYVAGIAGYIYMSNIDNINI